MSDNNQKSESVTVELSSEQKLKLFEEFREQQKILLQQAKEQKNLEKGNDDGKQEPPNKKRKRDDDRQSHSSRTSTDFQLEGEEASKRDSDIDPWLEQLVNSQDQQQNPYVTDDQVSLLGDPLDDLFKGDDSPDEVVVDDKELEGLLRSRYSAIMEHTKEKMGDPLVPNIEKMVRATWGKLKLAAKTKTDLQEKIPIPTNCSSLKAPRLNTEVYIRVHENASVKDKAMHDRQRDLTKAIVPTLKAMGELEKMEGIMEKNLKAKKKEDVTKEEATMYRSLKESLKQLTSSILMQNYHFTEITRNRKFDLCRALGGQFRPYASSDDTGEYLFGLEIQKLMKSELKKVSVKAKKSDQTKNFHAFGKSPRSNSGGQGSRFQNNTNRNYNSNQGNNSNQRGNYSNNSNNSNYNRNHQSRNRGRGKKW